MKLILRKESKRELQEYCNRLVPFQRRFINGQKKGQLIFTTIQRSGKSLLKDGFKTISIMGREELIDKDKSYICVDKPVMVDPYKWIIDFMEKEGIWEKDFKQALINATKAYDIAALAPKRETKKPIF